MDKNKNHLHYLQVIYHNIFLQVVIFILLSGQDGGLDGVLFDAKRIYEPLYGSVNVTVLLFEGLLLQINCVRVIFDNVYLVFCGFNAHKIIFVFDEINRQKCKEQKIFYSSYISI